MPAARRDRSAALTTATNERRFSGISEAPDRINHVRRHVERATRGYVPESDRRSDQGPFAVLLPWALDQLTHGPTEDLSVFRYSRRVDEPQGLFGPNRVEDGDSSIAGAA